MESRTIQIGGAVVTVDEAAETLQAIHGGRVDAVVVSNGEGHEVFTFRDAKHPFQLLIEAMSEGAVLTTLDGIICYLNPCFSTLIGMDSRQAVCRSLAEFAAPARAADLTALLERARTGPSARANLELIAHDGRLVPVQLSVSRAMLDDVEVFCVVVTDLTASVRQEELYRQARLEVEARDRLFSVAAHELRNPLAVLELQGQLLARLLDRSRNETVEQVIEPAKTIVEKVRRQSTRLGILVGKLLDVGTIGAGRLQLTRETVDLAEVVSTVLERSRPDLERSGSVVTAELRPARGHWDRVRLEQVIDNLISNAAKYGLGRPIRVFVESDPKVARVGVEDMGSGIPVEARERIFRPYERMAETCGQPGLGIGLYVTAEIVKAHGGTIKVEGMPDGGSRFVVELPIHDAV